MTDDSVETLRRANTLEVPMILVPEGQDPNGATAGFSINSVRIPVEVVLDAPDSGGAQSGFAGPPPGPDTPGPVTADPGVVRGRPAPDVPVGPNGQRPLAPHRAR